ncbi:MAG: LCP family protein [Saccharofermentanales bacterium]
MSGNNFNKTPDRGTGKSSGKSSGNSSGKSPVKSSGKNDHRAPGSADDSNKRSQTDAYPRPDSRVKIRRTADGRTVAAGLPNRAGRSTVSLSGQIRKPRRHRTGRRIFTVVGISALVIILISTIGISALWNFVFSGFRPDTGPQTTGIPTEALTYAPPFSEDITNILLIGADNSESDTGYGLSDSLIILTVDSKNNVVKMTSIMRDCYVYIPGIREPNKINAANFYGGPELALRTVNTTLRLNIQYYISVDIASMTAIIDIAGGVTLDVTAEEVGALNKVLYGARNDLAGPGIQKLNGTQAVQYARIRKIDSDTVRTQRQRNVLIALFRMFKDAGVVAKTQMIQQGLSQIRSNMTAKQITSLGMAVVPKLSVDVEQMKLPLDGYYKTNTYGGWYMVVDYNGTIPFLYEFIYGEVHPFDPVPTIPYRTHNYASPSPIPTTESVDISGESGTSEDQSGVSSEYMSGEPSVFPTVDPLATPSVTPEGGVTSGADVSPTASPVSEEPSPTPSGAAVSG